MLNLVKFSVEAGSYTNSYLQNVRNYIGVYVALSTNITEFFNGANTSETVKVFGVGAKNLLEKLPCSYIRSNVQQIHDNYCPSDNGISTLLHDAYIWNFVAFGALTLTFFLLGVWQILTRGLVKQLLTHPSM